MSELKVNKVSPRSGTTVTIGDSGDTINLVGTVQNNGSPLPGDISSVTAGTGLSGGGSTGDVTLNLDLNGLTTSTSDADGDFFAVVDAANAQKKLTKGNINISGFNNDSGFIDGSSLNADNLSSGTVPTARVSGAYTGITQTGTLTSFASTGIDDNATSTAVTINSSQNVGIGTSSPDEKLTVSGDMNVVSGSTYKIKSQVSSSYALNLGHDRIQIVNAASNPFLFYYGSTERMRITSSGNVGIGTSSPENKLDVRGIVNCTNASSEGSGTEVIRFARSDFPEFYHAIFASTGSGTSSDHKLDFRLNTGSSNTVTSRMTILGNGAVGIGTSSPATTLHIAAAIPKFRIQDTDVTSQAFDIRGASADVHFDLDPNNAVSGGDIKFDIDGSNKMIVRSSGNVGIGTSSPTGKLQVTTASSGATLNSEAGQLFLENSGNAGMTIGSGASSLGLIYFADSGDGNVGRIEYSHSENSMRFWTNDAETIRINANGLLSVNRSKSSNGGLHLLSKNAISISTSATNISATSSYGSLAFVWGVGGGNIFHDLVSWSLSQVDVIASQTISGAPAGRTYSASSGVLRVAMASGTYNVYEADIRTELS